jgi:4-amino-4-deoxychorismate lyase
MRTLVNGIDAGHVSAADRGLSFGDGVFETMLVADGRSIGWDAHLARLRRGCSVLGIDAPKSKVLRDEAEQLVGQEARAVLKLIVTRGEGGRGYAPARQTSPTRILSLHAIPVFGNQDYQSGVTVRWCELRLAHQPRLAGIKHLNRLEQVLARGEWQDPAIAEGLLCDAEGRVISATAANLFVVRAGQLTTPAVHRCGIAGTMREWVMARDSVQVNDLSPDQIESADELFLTSSLRGILPVARLGGRTWRPGPVTRALQQRLWREVPALLPGAD